MKDVIDQFLNTLTSSMPEGARELQSDIQAHLRATLERILEEQGLVSKTDFDLQTQVLARTREKLEALEKRLNELESRLS